MFFSLERGGPVFGGNLANFFPRLAVDDGERAWATVGVSSTVIHVQVLRLEVHIHHVRAQRQRQNLDGLVRLAIEGTQRTVLAVGDGESICVGHVVETLGAIEASRDGVEGLAGDKVEDANLVILLRGGEEADRKSTRLNSSHLG